MGRWVRIDRRYNQPYRLTSYASRAIFKWTGLVLAWVFVNSALAASHLGVLILATTAGLIWYGVHCARRDGRLSMPSPAMPARRPASSWLDTFSAARLKIFTSTTRSPGRAAAPTR